MEPLGLYVHIPFCRRKCYYCDFVSFPGREDIVDAYIDAVLSEARLYADVFQHRSVDTVFIGGGTPSLLSPAQMARLFWGLKDACNWAVGEFTIEANPETMNEEKLACCTQHGVNRLSLGLQTHDDAILSAIGRRHTYEQFLSVLNIAHKYFRNINVDTIFALPGQTVQIFEDTLRKLISLNVPHISCYALKLEEGTKLADEYVGTDEDTDREMYHSAAQLLAEAGYLHYETSNFALPGDECRHNLKYWTGKQYLGLGVAAHSYLDGETKTRHSNTENLKDYLRMIREGAKPIVHAETLTSVDVLEEYLMLRLRLTQGICAADYQDRFGEDFFIRFAEPIETAEKAGLIRKTAEGIKPTLKGFDLQNTLIGEFVGKL